MRLSEPLGGIDGLACMKKKHPRLVLPHPPLMTDNSPRK